MAQKRKNACCKLKLRVETEILLLNVLSFCLIGSKVSNWVLRLKKYSLIKITSISPSYQVFWADPLKIVLVLAALSKVNQWDRHYLVIIWSNTIDIFWKNKLLLIGQLATYPIGLMNVILGWLHGCFKNSSFNIIVVSTDLSLRSLLCRAQIHPLLLMSCWS